jgi:hypothetical protein
MTFFATALRTEQHEAASYASTTFFSNFERVYHFKIYWFD